MIIKELDKLVEHYHNNCSGGEYDYLDTDHLKNAFKYVYNKATDDFMRLLYHEAFETDSDLQKWDSGCWIRYKMAENIAEQLKKGERMSDIKSFLNWLKTQNVGVDYKTKDILVAREGKWELASEIYENEKHNEDIDYSDKQKLL